ncbi:flagellar GTP-binding protein FlhF [Gluconobacter frateurii NBRC 101659]|uniref:Flagellar GTP-binding protein FlhF n=1 Tax=Gluconobacter japonicus TaxID=376620 RepID=A0A9Q2FLK4_GLUJA|nr:GTP-binding signal recognition particle [Gluconobacter japonicus]MBF0871134.1 flagellar GTP-binding protein FlhF [Gluconobacter japonicus]GAP23600.1 flagellar GTP-binding protein FlhF [Gluconobacter frateurii NBRC 101659]
MRIKLIRGASMSVAMATLRETLGEEAFILSSRIMPDGEIELTAALDPEEEEAKEIIKSHFSVQVTPKKSLHDWHGLDLGCLVGKEQDLDYEKFLSENISFKTLNLSVNAPPLMVCGTPGSGKTLTIARLATRLALTGASPLVMTTDTERSGALEQLAACTRILGLDLIAVESSEMLENLCRTKRGRTPILIDTAATVPFDEKGMKVLATLQRAAQADLTLVHPAGEDAIETEETVSWFRKNGVRKMIVSRTDCARRLGGIVRSAMAGMSLVEASTGSQLIGGLRTLDAASLNELMTFKWEAASKVAADGTSKALSPNSIPVVSKRPTHSGSGVIKMNASSVTGAAALMKHIAAQGSV